MPGLVYDDIVAVRVQSKVRDRLIYVLDIAYMNNRLPPDSCWRKRLVFYMLQHIGEVILLVLFDYQVGKWIFLVCGRNPSGQAEVPFASGRSSLQLNLVCLKFYLIN
jgi:hypothetical protein